MGPDPSKYSRKIDLREPSYGTNLKYVPNHVAAIISR